MNGENLYNWCKKNGEYGTKLLYEFGDGYNKQYYFDENGVKKTPFDYSRGTHKTIKWTCSKCDLVFFSTPNLRTCPTHTGGGPACAGNKLVKGINDLYTWCIQNGERGEKILYEFGNGNNTQIYISEDKTYTPKDFSKATSKKIKWTCVNGHTWICTIKNRVLGNANCPKCNPTNLVVTGTNDLYTWCMQNGKYGELLLSELDKEIDAHFVAKKSSKKYLWTCRKGHTWEATVADRTSRLSYCPRCSGHSTSYPEQFLYCALKQLYPNAKNRFQAFKSYSRRGIEYDIALMQSVNGFNNI